MSSLKTFGILAGLGMLAAGALRSERDLAVEDDRDARVAIDRGVRQVAADFNPHVSLVQRDLKNFEVTSVRVTRSQAGAFIEKMADGDRNYDVYVRYAEGGSEKCATLALKYRLSERTWTTSHSGMDHCEPAW